jgi:hypothetical protein
MSLACIYCGSEAHGFGACTAFAERDAEIGRLRAELAEARKDAQRYQHLRTTDCSNEPLRGWWATLGNCLGESFDTAVDTAIIFALSEKK